MAHIKHRIGSTPRQRGSLSGQTCPDLFELTDGDYALIGTQVTDDMAADLPPELLARRQAGESIVLIPAVLLIDAKPDIPSA